LTNENCLSYILHKLGTPLSPSRKHGQTVGVEQLLDLLTLLAMQDIQ